MKTRHLITLGAIVALSSGCATITRGSTVDYTVTSDPTGARVSFSDGMTCETPCVLERSRKRGFVVKIEAECHQSQSVQVTTGISGGGAAGVAGNVIAGGLIGLGVDAISGAANDLTPNPLHVNLIPHEECDA